VTQALLYRIPRASASQIHRIGLFGHHFQVIALDGNPVLTPQLVNVIEIAPGERVDAIVEMNLPGVWILSELRDVARLSGMGIVVETPITHSRARNGFCLRRRDGTTQSLASPRRWKLL
jgi:FtsP/CotA-like multicopper oxidase with cupredoxin domain